MSEFDKSIKQAKKTHFRFNLLAIAMLGVMAFLLIGWLFLAKGYTLLIGPEPARQTVNYSLLEGVGFFSDNKLYSLSADTRFTVSAKGYISQEQSLNANSVNIVELTLKPKPARLTATTKPQVAEISWYLDDQLVLIGEEYITALAPGQYKVKLDSPYHQIITETFALTKDQDKRWQPELSPIAGKISLMSIPDGAQVMINQQAVGNTPLVIERPGGEYQVHINKPGYEVSQEVIKVTNQDPQPQRNYHLKPKSGLVTLSLKPGGGLLLIDGKEISNRADVALTSGKVHSVLYQKPGFYPHKHEISVSPGQHKQLVIKLQPEIGKVLLQASEQTQIFINGKSRGNAPLQTDLPAIAHQVQFKRPGYRTIEKRITPSAKSPTLVKVTLLTEYEARRKERKSTMAQQMGIEMASFKPDQVTTGSKANQQGRRRNEFVNQVQFTRNIEVSRHEISEAQYAKFKPGHSKSQLPVSDVSWLEAAQFCNWLSEQDGLPLFYSFRGARYLGVNLQSNGYRLPTEAEWEWLARKTKRVVETVFVWGNERRIPKKAGNFADESLKSTRTFYLKQYEDGYVGKAPVGSFKADRGGLFDMAGNVSEWVHDNYTNTPPTPGKRQIDPLGASRGVGHAFKGGNYQTGRLSELRAAYREPSMDKAVTLGFRIARYQD